MNNFTSHLLPLTSYLLFLTVLFFIIKKPFNIGIGWSATVGAILALLFGVVSFEDVFRVVEIVWDPTLALRMPTFWFFPSLHICLISVYLA